MNTGILTSKNLTLIVSLMGIFGGCAPPPPGPPQEVEALLGFLFEHMGDEDSTPLVDGVNTLREWYLDEKNLQDGQQGFVINNLDQNAVNMLDDVERSTQNLKGMSVVTKSGYCPQHIALNMLPRGCLGKEGSKFCDHSQNDPFYYVS